MPAPIVALRGVSKSYRSGGLRNQVLHGIDLEIQEGELVAIVGKSGSGKSTLLNVVGGLDRDFEGEAHVAGQDLPRSSDVELGRFRNEKVGFIFQQFNLLEHLSCLENVALPSMFARGPAEGSETRARRALERVGIGERAHDLPANLSGGQKQRVAIARALFNHPPLLLCDEPTGNLDSQTGLQIIELFRELNAKDGITLVIVTHEGRVSEAVRRIVRLEDGRIVDDAPSRPESSAPASAPSADAAPPAAAVDLGGER
jgi:putative ABC transport system ATP-binding protein